MDRLYEKRSQLTKEQKRLFNKMHPKIGELPSLALIDTHGPTSLKEIEAISVLIEQFCPLHVTESADNLRGWILLGEAPKRHTIRILLQYKVKNADGKSRSWAIDLVIEIIRKLGNKDLKIGAIGVEYDGHPRHFVESGVFRAYARDMHISTDTGIQVIRIADIQWKSDPQIYIDAIKRFVKRKISDAEEIISETVGLLTSKVAPEREKFTTCPVCECYCSLAGDFCPVCKGVGAIYENICRSTKIEDFQILECKACKLGASVCRLCLGSGSVSLARAIEQKRDEALEFERG